MARIIRGDKFNNARQQADVNRELGRLRGDYRVLDLDDDELDFWDTVETEERFGRGAPKSMKGDWGW